MITLQESKNPSSSVSTSWKVQEEKDIQEAIRASTGDAGSSSTTMQGDLQCGDQVEVISAQSSFFRQTGTVIRLHAEAYSTAYEVKFHKDPQSVSRISSSRHLKVLSKQNGSKSTMQWRGGNDDDDDDDDDDDGDDEDDDDDDYDCDRFDVSSCSQDCPDDPSAEAYDAEMATEFQQKEDHDFAMYLHQQLNNDSGASAGASATKADVSEFACAGSIAAAAAAGGGGGGGGGGGSATGKASEHDLENDSFLQQLKNTKAQMPPDLSTQEKKEWTSRQFVKRQSALSTFGQQMCADEQNHLMQRCKKMQQDEAGRFRKEMDKVSKEKKKLQEEETKLRTKSLKQATSSSLRSRKSKKKWSPAEKCVAKTQDFGGCYYYDSDEGDIHMAVRWQMGDSKHPPNMNDTVDPATGKNYRGQTTWVTVARGAAVAGKGGTTTTQFTQLSGESRDDYVMPRIQEFIHAVAQGDGTAAQAYGRNPIRKGLAHSDRVKEAAGPIGSSELKLPIDGSYLPSGAYTRSGHSLAILGGDDAAYEEEDDGQERFNLGDDFGKAKSGKGKRKWT